MEREDLSATARNTSAAHFSEQGGLDAIEARQLLRALKALKRGDFSVRMPATESPLGQELADAFNDVVELNDMMGTELARIGLVVGKQGMISQRARMGNVTGAWADGIDSINHLISDMVKPTSEMSRVIGAVAKGDLSQRMQLEIDGYPLQGEFLRIGKVVNAMADQLNSFTTETIRVAREVGTEGKLGGQAKVKGVAGTWKDLTDSVNLMAANLRDQVRNIAEVTTAVARGDLSKKITVDVKGEILELKSTINTMVDQLGSFASEVTRVAREVGTEGKLGGQADVRGVGGIWKDLTDNVNSMAANLTSQVRNIADVTTAVARGDLSKKITVNVKGEILELKNTINTMVDQLNSFASEVTRVAREVGTEGKLGGQANVAGVGGTWKDLTDNVNSMAANLTSQVRNIADVTTAVARGDLSKKITVDVKGEILELKNTINTMVDQLGSFASEVSRVAREVGTDGKLGGQAQVKGVAGTWKDLTDNVNSMAANLTSQVRNIADVTTAVARGDLSKKITVDVKGEILELKNTINTMVDQLSSFASEVSRVAREVGTDGKLGGQAQVKGVAGTWKDLTDNVNAMARNLTGQVRNIADVTTAVARGDLSKKITVDVQGEILELKNTINTMVDQLNSFASEVTRVAREVGTEGKLGGQANVPGVDGIWEDLTDNVNSMAGNLTGQVRNIAEVTTAVARGDLSKKITVDVKGEILELKSTINTMVDQLNSFASEVTRVAREVGTEGKLGGQAQVRGVAGTWKDLTDNVNAMASNLTGQVRNIADVTTAVARGDLSKKITVDVKGEILELKNTINTMVDQLGSFASEVTRMAREVGTEGKLGGQANVLGVGGIWKDLTDNVNSMAANLTNQVRRIADVVTAVANGDLKRKLAVEAKGEIAALADTINGMIDTLATFADQVTNVAREVGIEGKLGGQAKVPGAAGLWRDLTDNVNQLAANLTTQVRAIAEVATAVTKGDLTRSITVLASGEVASLKDNINEMISNLRETTLKNTEQDWLKTNVAKFTKMLQGQRDLLTVSRLVLSELAPLVNAQHGVFYITRVHDKETALDLQAAYAYKGRSDVPTRFQLGEGLIGQCAYEKKRIFMERVPKDYIKITSGLGESTPRNIIVMPVLFEGEVKAVIELASFGGFSETHQSFLDQLMESIGIVLNTIEANMRTEDLLTQSQSLTAELQSQQQELKNTNDRLEQQAENLRKSEELLKAQQEELQTTNSELEEKARLLSEQKAQVELKNREVELAKVALEEKAEQLALASKYKSEFLANMSHELRTPLNSLLILARLLSDNPANNLLPKQVEFAKTIHAAGSDLLALINDILDLSKIESGTFTLEMGNERFNEMRDYVERTFRQLAHDKQLEFSIKIDNRLPATIQTDAKRLQQIFKNLLSNAFKFTDKGSVSFKMELATEGWSSDNEVLGGAESVVAFSVVDTGIGIRADKQKIIFEAFQQADGTTSRKYGGTGLGLSISREIARRLGGELTVSSEPGTGSVFTLYLPLRSGGAQTGIRSPFSTPDEIEREDFVPRSGLVQKHLEHDDTPVDDRTSIQEGDLVLLVIDSDREFCEKVQKIGTATGVKTLIAWTGTAALALAAKHEVSAIFLNTALNDMDGWAVLDLLKHDLSKRHIPVQMVTRDTNVPRGLMNGAVGCMTNKANKAEITRALKRLKKLHEKTENRVLVIEDQDIQREYLTSLLTASDMVADGVGTAQEAIDALESASYDCVVVDLTLPDMDGVELLRTLRSKKKLYQTPMVVYTAKELNNADQSGLWEYAESIITKDASSPARLVSETMLLMHVPLANMLPEKQDMIRQLGYADRLLAGKKVLIVDDDIRNIFSLTCVLEEQEMEVTYAENGNDAIDTLKQNAGIDVVLMDVMMPDMDGYDTMRAIRSLAKFENLPMIAITAKAMKGDREKCIEAGASDYMAKPIDVAQLLALLRVWLHRAEL